MQQNKEHSKDFCKKRSEQLLDPIRKRVESPPTYDEYDSSQLRIELDHARQRYEELARGPEKGAVLQEMTQNCEQLEAGFKRLEEHHKKLMREKQKRRQAELRAGERESQLQQLRSQAQDMPQAHLEILQKMEEEHRKMMEEIALEQLDMAGINSKGQQRVKVRAKVASHAQFESQSFQRSGQRSQKLEEK
ncbi:PREDICTED: actin cytoskeleton-regulatory complex protein pan-1-like [Branchiostoma belcheri]|uniref:Actin cytoskeleton-regulatory complex protein pan-1-like n=1 Tax=Branchiostoma belcheri TaxID=7741 RepID=A0A6P5A893_BRABE|nr:PREDICTED: actin cytoskeleton-regulatory complex protein pan-1-like [Branchiostoma belcheri]